MNARLSLPAEDIQQAAASDFSLEVKKIAILVFPGFSLTSLSSFLSPFKSFNAIRQKDIFRWTLASECGRTARSDLGIDMPVGSRFSDFASSLHLGKKFDMLVLIADGPMPSAPISAELAGIIRRCVRQHIPVVALGTAPWLLAEAGLLDSKRCTIHWSKLAVFTETFRASRATDSIFVRDRAIWTCAGELAAFDVAVALLNDIASEDLSDEVCRRNLSDILRTEGSRQSGASPWNLPLAPEKLKQALELMIKNIDDPLPLARLASSIKPTGKVSSQVLPRAQARARATVGGGNNPAARRNRGCLRVRLPFSLLEELSRGFRLHADRSSTNPVAGCPGITPHRQMAQGRETQ
jgi:AraC family transcriptional regulator, glycine betaine-responsive activator